MDIKEIQNLIKFVAKSGASEVKLETEDLKITIRTGPLGAAVSEPVYMQQMPMAASPVAPSTEASAPAVQTAPASEDHLITIKSPIIGTFYRKPAPDKPPFVEIGSHVNAGDVVCIVEAMKMMNEIKSEFTGKVSAINIDDGEPVEFDQSLIVIG